MKKLSVIKCGGAEPGEAVDYGQAEDWLKAAMDLQEDQVRTFRVYDEEDLPAVSDVEVAVITGSADSVYHRLPWSERISAWLPGIVEKGCAVLGICYGHQLLAHAFGGEVIKNPKGWEITTVEVTLLPAAAEDGLFRGFDSRLRVHAGHYDTVGRLPDGAVRLACNEMDANHAFRLHPDKPVWGVQFHPEFPIRHMHTALDDNDESIRADGLDTEKLRAGLKPTPQGTALLQRFAQLSGLK